MAEIHDFLAAAYAMVDASPRCDQEAIRIYLGNFSKYTSFAEVSNEALVALMRNLKLVAAEGYNRETQEQLVSILEALLNERR